MNLFIRREKRREIYMNTILCCESYEEEMMECKYLDTCLEWAFVRCKSDFDLHEDQLQKLLSSSLG